jgi:ABC-type oligopeptide transport system ATPase subunit
VLVSGYRYSSRFPGEKNARIEAGDILEEVGLSREDLERRPSEFSGGQRQRISIARGLLLKPELLICDEVVSALDVSIQGQILNLLLDIREKRGISFLFIAHDLRVACYFCDRIGVMYRGELMEEAPAAELYRNARHPYTRLLFSSVSGAGISLPGPGASGAGAFTGIPGGISAGLSAGLSAGTGTAPGNRTAPADASAPSAGCPFAPRCIEAQERCFAEHPEIGELETGHKIRCFKTESKTAF